MRVLAEVLAQFNYVTIYSFEKDYILSLLKEREIAYEGLVAIENWDNQELNKIAKKYHYKDNYLNFIIKNLAV
jgi:hypothetical protein